MMKTHPHLHPDQKILVTGANGLVGSALLQRLRADGFHNLLLPRSKELDLRNQQQVRDYFATHRPEVVFHLAGHIGGIGGSIARPVEFLYENELMALLTLHAAYEFKVKKLLFLGSSCIYPRLCPQPMKEEHLLTGLLEPTNEGYALAKISGMKLCEYMNRQYGTDFMSLMPCNLYGYKDHFEPQNSHVLSALLYKFHKAKTEGLREVEVWGTGKARREFLIADDLADAMVYFMSHFNAREVEPFVNVGSGIDVSILELAQMIQSIVGYSGQLRFDTNRPDGIPQKLMDVSKAKSLGWAAKTSLDEGIRKVYASYLRQLNESASSQSGAPR